MADVVLIGYEGVEENLGMRSLAAFLERRGISTAVLSCDEYDANHLAFLIRNENPRVVGFSLVFQGYFSRFSQLIMNLRRQGVHTHFTMGGHFPSLAPTVCLQRVPGLDTIVRGEGELTLLELVCSADSSAAWEGIRGLAFRRRGKVILTPPRALIKDLDSLPYPLRSGRISRFRGIGICPMLSSRGCYYDCAFCSIQSFYRVCPGPRRRNRSPENVVDEMLQLSEESSVRVFIFRDDDLCTRGTAQQEWIAGFVRALRHRRLDKKVFWRISCRVDEVNREILLQLMDVGLGALFLGIESGNEDGLRTLNKRYNTCDISRAVDTLVDIDLPFEYGFMMFDPSSTLVSLRSNLDVLTSICRRGNVPMHFTKMIPYSGTPIAELLRRTHRLGGTVNAPTYTYRDERVKLVESTLGQLLESLGNGKFKVADRLAAEKFEALLRRRFFPNENGVQNVLEGVARRTAAYNKRVTSEVAGVLDAIEGFGPLPWSLIKGAVVADGL